MQKKNNLLLLNKAIIDKERHKVQIISIKYWALLLSHLKESITSLHILPKLSRKPL